MAADAYSSVLGALLMGTGNDNNQWGNNLNSAVMQILEDAIAGMLTNTVTGGTLDLSTPAPPSAASLARYAILLFNGTLGSRQTIIVPALSKTWMIINSTTGDIYMQTPGGTVICIPKSTRKRIICDGTNVVRQDLEDIGRVEMFAGPSVPAGKVECDNSLYLRTDKPELFAAIGTTWGNTDATNFRVPPGTDTGRFPRSRKAGIDDAGTTYSNQVGSHTHTGTVSITGSTDTGGNHNHAATSTASVTDPGHTHIYTGYGNGGSGTGADAPQTSGTSKTTQLSVTGITVGVSTAIAPGGAHAHSVTGSGSFTTNASGGTETRPESTVYRFCIRY